MKNVFFALSTGIVLGIVLLVGCKTVEQAVIQAPEEAQQQELKRELIPWENQFPAKYGDPLSLFNEHGITTVASKSSYLYKMEDGIVKRIPSSKFTFNIPAKTSGVISKMGSTNEKQVNVCFFEGSDTYITFVRVQGLPGFYANGKATVYIDGIPYTVDIQINGKGDGRCKLLIDLQDEENPDNEDKVATGIVPMGTKEIK